MSGRAGQATKNASVCQQSEPGYNSPAPLLTIQMLQSKDQQMATFFPLLPAWLPVQTNTGLADTTDPIGVLPHQHQSLGGTFFNISLRQAFLSFRPVPDPFEITSRFHTSTAVLL